MMEPDPGPVEIPIDGILDLHAFAPKDAPSLVEEYIGVCQEKEIYDLRIIHGKGKGVLRRVVHARLERDSRVLEFGLDPGSSGWGATLVRLKRNRKDQRR
ncbi:MAG: Smr/MutS family protein [Deltaproteobacteria bacterium]|nr:Smr/MutS family protein [Deltaproteobacteria bacterium]